MNVTLCGADDILECLLWPLVLNELRDGSKRPVKSTSPWLLWRKPQPYHSNPEMQRFTCSVLSPQQKDKNIKAWVIEIIYTSIARSRVTV